MGKPLGVDLKLQRRLKRSETICSDDTSRVTPIYIEPDIHIVSISEPHARNLLPQKRFVRAWRITETVCDPDKKSSKMFVAYVATKAAWSSFRDGGLPGMWTRHQN